MVDTEAGGESLADDPTYDRGSATMDAAASLFVDIPGVVAAAEEAGELEAASSRRSTRSSPGSPTSR